MKPAYWDEAARTLARRDRVLRKLIRACPDVHLKRRSDPFTTLARAIVSQQISVKAADTIWRRFVAAVAPAAKPVAFPKLDAQAVDDIGLQRAVALHYHGGRRIAPAAIRELALGWQPWRSVATWYLWRSLDPVPVEY